MLSKVWPKGSKKTSVEQYQNSQIPNGVSVIICMYIDGERG